MKSKLFVFSFLLILSMVLAACGPSAADDVVEQPTGTVRWFVGLRRWF
jgi:hypothetical protein